jgi:isopentenyl-diphosphate Delta-isomerase
MAANLNMLVDIVDEQNRVVGQDERQHVLSKRLNFRTVHVILKNHGDDIILQRLKGDHRRSPGLLGSSAAGYLHSKETYAAAARRKLLSELGLITELTSLGRLEMLDVRSRKFIEVFVGYMTQQPIINHDEIADLVLMKPDKIDADMVKRPEIFTATFRVVYAFFRGKNVKVR